MFLITRFCNLFTSLSLSPINVQDVARPLRIMHSKSDPFLCFFCTEVVHEGSRRFDPYTPYCGSRRFEEVRPLHTLLWFTKVRGGLTPTHLTVSALQWFKKVRGGSMQLNHSELEYMIYYVQLHIDDAILCIVNDVMIVLY